MPTLVFEKQTGVICLKTSTSFFTRRLFLEQIGVTDFPLSTADYWKNLWNEVAASQTFSK